MADDQFENVLAHLAVARRKGDRAECYCPAHSDDRPSLSVSRGAEHPVVLHCHAGCSADTILAALGLSWAALIGSDPHVTATYAYTDAAGKPLYYVERWVPKSFRPRLPDGTWARPSPSDEVLYRLPDIHKAIADGKPVYLVEGEKDCEEGHSFGMTCTTAMSGASQPWLPQFTDQLAGAQVVIVADNDEPGRRRARRLTDELWSHASSVRAVLPRFGKDLTDHLWAGFTPELLDPLPAEGTLIRYKLSQVAAATIGWAWQAWIPDGMFTLIEGDPGDGKSVLTVDLAARWTTGAAMPDGTPNPFGGPVNVGMVSAEDDPARVIRPRFALAGGDLDRLVYIAGAPLVGGRYTRTVDLGNDIDSLREAIEAEHLKVLVLDPLMAFVGNVKTAIDSEVRQMLTPLRYLAEETGCAIVAVRHLRKAGGKAVYAGGGSVAFTGAARSVLMVGRSPRDPELRVLASTKVNLALTPASLSYRLMPGEGHFAIYPYVDWQGEVELTAADLMTSESSEQRQVYVEVVEAVVGVLGTGEMEFLPLKKALLQQGVECSEGTLRRVLREVTSRTSLHRGTSAQKVVYRLREMPTTVVPPSHPTNEDEPVNPQANTEMADPTRPSFGPNPQPDGEEAESAKEVEGLRDGDATPANISQSGRGLTASPGSHDSSDVKRDLDLDVACSVCGQTDPALILYWEELRCWRCRAHAPGATL